MANKAKVTVVDATDIQKGVSVKGSGSAVTGIDPIEVSSNQVSIKDSSSTQKGSTTLSTDALTIDGIDNQTSVTPQNLKAKLGDQTLGKIAIGQGTDQSIHWGDAVSPDGSITVNYNPTTKNLEFKVANDADVTNICLENTVFSNGEQRAEPICIPPDENGSFTFTSDSNLLLTAITNGVHFSLSGSAEDPNIIIISDETTISRTAQDRTIYIVNMVNPVKTSLIVPSVARLGFWFRVIGINGGATIGTAPGFTQYLKYKNSEVTDYLATTNGWDDFIVFCYEENVRFKWLTF